MVAKCFNIKYLLSILVITTLFISPVLGQDNAQKITELLDDIKTYDYDQSRASLSELSENLKAILDSDEDKARVEEAMIALLDGEATFAAKQFVCKNLSLIGTEESVPVLVKLLKTPETANIALYALERIPGDKVNKALRKNMSKVDDKTKIGIINTLGSRRDSKAVKKLAKGIKDKDAAIAKASIAALGKIADKKATKKLSKAVDKVSAELKESCLDALLKCADANNNLEIYANVYQADNPGMIRVAALRGMVAIQGDEALPTLEKALQSEQAKISTAAAALVRELPKDTDLSSLIAVMDQLPDGIKIQLMYSLADRQEKAARKAVVAAVGSDNTEYKIAALNALAKVGTAADVKTLVDLSNASDQDVKTAANTSLNTLKGQDVDKKIIDLIGSTDATSKQILIQSVTLRHITEAVPVLMRSATDENPRVRREAFKSLGNVASPKVLSGLIDLVVAEENNTVQQEGVKALASVASKQAGDKGAKIRAAMTNAETVVAKGALLQALGTLGDRNSLPILREMLQSDDMDLKKASVRAMSGWTDDNPVADLMDVVKTTDDATLKILALRGYLGLLKLENERSASESVQLYLDGMEQAEQVNEKRMVLSGLAQVRSMIALETVAKYLDDPELQPEAEVAVFGILRHLENPDKDVVKEIMQSITETSTNEMLKGFAKSYLENM